MIPYARQDISEDDIEQVVHVLRSDFLTQGQVVPAFENAISKYCGSKHTVAVNSATSALHLACLALGLGPGDWLWTSPNTFVASANCAIYCGAQVDFVDIDPVSFNMSVEELELKLISAEKTGTLPKVVMPVHFAGQPCDMKKINGLAKKYGFWIVEDASHAIGSSYRISLDETGELGFVKTGSCIYSDITVFSFHPVKIVTSGEGGAAVTNNEALASRMRLLRSHGITTDPEFFYARPSEEIWNYQQIDLGFNYRMTDILAALGISQLRRIDDYIARRHAIASFYNESLANVRCVTPQQGDYAFSSYHLYPIRIVKKDDFENQRGFFEFLRSKNILVNLHYIPVHRHPFYEKLGFEAGDYPVSERFFSEAISLPMFPTLTDAQQANVIEKVEEFFS